MSFIGSHTVNHLLKHDVAEIRIYDNFCRGTHANISSTLKDSRVKINYNPRKKTTHMTHRAGSTQKAKDNLDYYATINEDGLNKLFSLKASKIKQPIL